MKRLIIVIWLSSAVSVLGQNEPPPCGEKGVPGDVPCVDLKTGKLMHTKSPGFTPHQELPPAPSPAHPVVIPKVQPTANPIVVPATSVSIPAPLAASASKAAQTWSYEGTQSCYHDTGTVQCFDQSTLQEYASSQEQFDAQFQAGEVVGSAIGGLMQAWIAHRHELALERKDIREQISAYYGATFDLTDEVAHDQEALVSVFTRLAQLDPVRKSIYEQSAQYASTSWSRFATMRPIGEKMLREIRAQKNVKYLRRSLGDAQKTYNVALEGNKKEYVYSQLMHGLLGYYEHQQNAPAAPAQTAPSPAKVTP